MTACFGSRRIPVSSGSPPADLATRPPQCAQPGDRRRTAPPARSDPGRTRRSREPAQARRAPRRKPLPLSPLHLEILEIVTRLDALRSAQGRVVEIHPRSPQSVHRRASLAPRGARRDWRRELPDGIPRFRRAPSARRPGEATGGLRHGRGCRLQESRRDRCQGRTTRPESSRSRPLRGARSTRARPSRLNPPMRVP